MTTLEATLPTTWRLRPAHALALALGVAAVAAVEAATGLLVANVSVRLLVAIVVIAGASALCFVAPRIALFSLVAVWGALHVIILDFKLFTLGAIEVTLSRAIGVAILVFLGLSVGYLVATQPRLPLALRALLVFWLLYGIGAAVAGTASAASDLMRFSASVVLAVVAYYVVDTRGRFERLLDLATLCGTLVAAVTVAQFLVVHAAPDLAHSVFGSTFYSRSYAPGTGYTQFATRVHGPLGGADETGVFLLVALGFAVLRSMLRADTSRRARTYLPILLIALGIIATLTRTAIAAALVLFFVMSLQRQLRSIDPIALRARLLAMVAVVGAVAALVVGPSALQSRLADLNPRTSGASFAQGRASIWHYELAVVRSSDAVQVLTGHGVHSSYAAAGGASPHNVPLWLLVEVGLLGCGAYFFFFGSATAVYFATARSKRFGLEGKTAALGLSVLAAVAVADMFVLTPLSSGSGWYFMIFVGATLRACRALPADEAQTP